MPEVTLERPQPQHTEDLGRICYEAFRDVSERHGFESDFHSVEFAQAVIGANVRSETSYSIAAFLGGRPAGSNFMTLGRDVGGIGPISVDVAAQGRGIGRMLMEDALRHASDTGIERVRLVQDAFNVVSMSLYAAVGFDTKEPLGLLQLAAGERPRRIYPARDAG